MYIKKYIENYIDTYPHDIEKKKQTIFTLSLEATEREMRWEKIREEKSRVNVQDLFFGGVCFVGSVVDVRWREEEAEAAVVRSTRKCNDVDDGKLDLVFFILSCHSLERHRYSLFSSHNSLSLSACFSLFLYYYYYYMLKMELRKELPYTLLYTTIKENIICSILSTSLSLCREKKLSKLSI